MTTCGWPAKSAAAWAWAAVRKPSRTPERAGRLGVPRELLLPAEQRGRADPAAHEQRARAVGRRAEADAERAHQGEALVGRQLGEALGARADRLEQEVERERRPASARARAYENARGR